MGREGWSIDQNRILRPDGKVMHSDPTLALHVDLDLSGPTTLHMGVRVGSYGCAEKERKKLTDNPREGWEDGTPPPHRDF